MMPLYRSKLDSPLEANPTKYRGGGLSPLDANPIKYRSREHSPALIAEWTPPPGLWAWFKHNEGSGIPIIDYSPNAANGTLVSDGSGGPIPTAAELNYFWNTNPGFGTGNPNTNFDCRTLRIVPPANTTYASILAFIKPMGDGAFNPQQCVQLGEGGGHFIQVGYRFASPHYWIIGLPAGSYQATVEAAVFGTWYCVYAFSQVNTTNTGIYVRKSGDSGWTLARGGDSSGNIGVTQNGVYMFGGTNNSVYVIGGDALYFASLYSLGIIGLAQATSVYNGLRSRYGMS